MTEDEARDAITEWAKDYYTESEENAVPEVEIVKIAYNEGKKEWSVELEVSTSADHRYHPECCVRITPKQISRESCQSIC